MVKTGHIVAFLTRRSQAFWKTFSIADLLRAHDVVRGSLADPGNRRIQACTKPRGDPLGLWYNFGLRLSELISPGLINCVRLRCKSAPPDLVVYLNWGTERTPITVLKVPQLGYITLFPEAIINETCRRTSRNGSPASSPIGLLHR